MPRCVGLTGGIASGKSTVARYFEALGVPVIDADQVARDVVQPGSAGLQAVLAQFGADFQDVAGGLDRRKLRELVFSDPAQRKHLEALLHPLIRAALMAWRNELTAGYGILMAPIMREAGFDTLVERILVVDTDRSTQKSRLMARDGIDETLAEQMLNAQASRTDRLGMADDVIANSGPLDALHARVEALHEIYFRWAADTALS